MKDLKAVKGKFHIAKLIEEGEHEHQDFKHSVSDASKIAHSISAFANHSGGRLLIGVKDNGAIAGVRNEEDIYVVEQAGLMYCNPPQEVNFKAFTAEGGARVIVAEVAEATRRPVLARETDGSWKAYYRVADENLAAHPLMVKIWEKKYSDAPGAVLSEAHRRLMSSLNQDETFDINRAAVAAKVSLATAERILVDLGALDLITFRREGGRFLICFS